MSTMGMVVETSERTDRAIPGEKAGPERLDAPTQAADRTETGNSNPTPGRGGQWGREGGGQRAILKATYAPR